MSFKSSERQLSSSLLITENNFRGVARLTENFQKDVNIKEEAGEMSANLLGV